METRINSLKDNVFSLVGRFVSRILWVVFLVVLFFVSWYFYAHLSQASFVDNAMGNLFATVIGVVAGVPVALWITTHLQKAQERKEAESECERDKESLDSRLSRVYTELYSNSLTVERLQEALSHETGYLELEELWEWAESIADGFEFSAHDDFQRMDARKYAVLTVDAHVYAAYTFLKGLSDRIREAHASFWFFHGVTDKGQERMYAELETVRDMSSSTLSRISEAIRCLGENEGKYRELRAK